MVCTVRWESRPETMAKIGGGPRPVAANRTRWPLTPRHVFTADASFRIPPLCNIPLYNFRLRNFLYPEHSSPRTAITAKLFTMTLFSSFTPMMSSSYLLWRYLSPFSPSDVISSSPLRRGYPPAPHSLSEFLN